MIDDVVIILNRSGHPKAFRPLGGLTRGYPMLRSALNNALHPR
jgi:hypothetical protein